tara:strand:+ start:2946 stop:4181 length:1236 start_codon:yes stop_codon:yes gene_type:complete
MFFQLDARTLNKVMTEYGTLHGQGKRSYAEATYQKWKRGYVKMGGDISDRLVRLVPQFLDFDQKYALVLKLQSRLQPPEATRVWISPTTGLGPAIAAVMAAVEQVGTKDLPAIVQERLKWLADDDAIAAEELLKQIATREAQVAAETVESELRQMLAVASQHTDKLVTGSRLVSLPGATVEIIFHQNPGASREHSPMSQPENNSEPSKDLPPQKQNTRQDVVPLRNPNDLLGEALQRMAPAQQEKVLGKATEEALRLQVKSKEGQIDNAMASDKVEGVATAAERLGQTGNDFSVQAEHRSEHGSVKVTVSKQSSLTQRVGKCFVATACYGHYDHPTVVVLRTFRDSVLTRRKPGRLFVAWYYRHSPDAARVIEGSRPLRLATRVVLLPLVALARISLHAQRLIRKLRRSGA